jgi:hypothetical protein
MSDGLLGLPDQRWVSIALAFNFHPASYLHASWFDTIEHGDMARRLCADPDGAADVSRYLLPRLELMSRFHSDFSNPCSRLALLPGATFEHLCLYLGLVLRSETLRREILGARLRELKKAVGDEAVAFVFKRVPLLGAIPDFPFEPQLPADDLRQRFTLIGARFCILPLAAEGDALLRRVLFKLPQSWASQLAADDDDDFYLAEPDRHAPLPPVVRKLIKELVPQWHPLFA